MRQTNKVPITSRTCKLRNLITEIHQTQTERFLENQRIDQLRTIRETALPILKQPVI